MLWNICRDKIRSSAVDPFRDFRTKERKYRTALAGDYMASTGIESFAAQRLFVGSSSTAQVSHVLASHGRSGGGCFLVLSLFRSTLLFSVIIR